MRGTSSANFMNGFAGNDNMNGGNQEGDNTMNGGSGDDFMIGSANGNDKINGDSGDDTILGSTGTDILIGSSGNDKIYHEVFSNPPTQSDGSKDTIDCGVGNDEAWINVSQDHDTAASNCETVHAG